MVVDRNGRDQTLTVTPVDGRTVHEAGATPPKGTAPYGVIGVSLQLAGADHRRRSRPSPRPASTFGHLAWGSIAGFAHFFTPHEITQGFDNVTSAKAAHQSEVDGTRPLSTVGVVQTADDAVHAGLAEFLSFLVVINIFFGIFNLFPMLPLDGGHVAIAVYEKIRTGRRKVMYHADVAKLMPFTWLFIAFLGRAHPAGPADRHPPPHRQPLRLSAGPARAGAMGPWATADRWPEPHRP